MGPFRQGDAERSMMIMMRPGLRVPIRSTTSVDVGRLRFSISMKAAAVS
jgi:hypothetical protein